MEPGDGAPLAASDSHVSRGFSLGGAVVLARAARMTTGFAQRALHGVRHYCRKAKVPTGRTVACPVYSGGPGPGNPLVGNAYVQPSSDTWGPLVR